MKIPASYHQERLWFIDKFETGNLYESSPLYHNIPLIMEITGPLAIHILERSIKEVINRHEALQTRIITFDDRPFQLIDPKENFKLEVIDLSNNKKEGDKEALRLAIEKSREAFSIHQEQLIRGTLIRIGDHKSLLVLTLHHLISDKYSLEIMTREMNILYESFMNGKAAQLSDLPIHYADFSQWQRELPDDMIESLLIFWKKNLSGTIPKLEFPTDFPRAAIHIYQPESQSFTLPHGICSKIRVNHSHKEIDDFVILLTVFKILLSRYSQQDEIIVGIINKNRHQPGTEEIIGPVANLIPLKSNLPAQCTFPELVEDLNEKLQRIVNYVDMPFDKLVLELNPEKDMSRTALFDVIFQYEKNPLKEIRIGELKINVIEKNLGWGKYDLNMLIQANETSVQGTLVYNKQYFNDSTIARFIDHYKVLLESIWVDPTQPLSKLPILSEKEKHQLIVEWNQTRCNYPRTKNLQEIFQQQVEKTPHQAALGYESLLLTYKELNRHAHRLAHYLRTQWNIKPNDLVGVMLGRTEWMIIALLGILKAGGAYVPIEPNYPQQRVNYILNDSNCRLLITDSHKSIEKIVEKSSSKVLNMQIIDSNREIDTARSNQNQNPLENINIPQDSAYVIYTSGTTGYPKGCIISHRNIIRLFKNDHHPFDFNSKDIWIMAHSFCFDFSVWDMYGALLYGGKLILPAWDTVRDVHSFCSLIKKYQISVLNQTPGAFYNLIAEEKKSGSNTLNKHLRCVCLGGEKLEPIYLKEWTHLYSLRDIQLINMFGITETTVHVTYYEIKESDMEATHFRSPIGSPLPETTVYIFDKNLSPVPIGIKGELFVGGSGVAKGYLNNTPLTFDRFIENPHKKGEIIYKTGDIGRWLPDGTMEYLGRNDEQVKIRGYRIELGEIENVLLGFEKIKQTVVRTWEDPQKNRSLVAYFTARQKLNVTEIKQYLEKIIPVHMIPAYFIQLDDFLLTTTGKIDKKTLPEPGERAISKDEYQAPQNETEKALVEIWQEVLGLREIGIKDDFFSSGGDSIKGIRVINKIQEKLGEIVHIAALFQAPTVEELAAKLDSYKENKSTKIDADKVAELRQIIIPPPPLQYTGPKNPPTVFILSPYRSGSTLLRIILGGHPKLFAPPELELLSFNTLQERKAALAGNYLSEGTLRAIMELKNSDVEETIAIMEECEEHKMITLEFYRMLQSWLGDKILVEKTPSYTFNLEILQRAEMYFENPKYIHLLRNPYASIYSFVEAKIDQVVRFNHNFSVQELGELLWYISNQNTLEFLKKIPDQRKHTIKYENLVSNPAGTTAGICDFLGLEYDENMIRVYDGARQRMTNGVYAESKMIGDVKFFTHSNINKTAADNWKKKHKEDFLGDITYQLAASLGYFEKKRPVNYTRIEPVSQAEYYTLSPAQKRLWILNQFEKGKIAYNSSHAYLLEGDLKPKVFKKSLETLVELHESLRTTFITVEDEPWQKIHDLESIGFKLEYIDLKNEQNPDQQTKTLANEEAAFPFDLEQGPLLRAKLIHLQKSKYVFLLSLHHIISDGWSMNTLIGEILTLYESYKNNKPNPLLLLRLQYKDYSVWQNSEIMRKTLKQQEDYWLKEFEGEIPVLNLPTDYPRPAIQSFAGNIICINIDAHEATALNQLANSQGVTLFMVLLTAFNIFLSKISSQEDIVVGTPIAGRNHPDLERIIGMFVNTLAIRSCPNGEKTFITFLNEVKEKTLKVFENQDLQFEDLVEKVSVQRDMSRNPLFDVMFTLLNIFDTGRDLLQANNREVKIKPYPQEHTIAKFDLSLSAIEEKDKLIFTFEYCTKLFKKETIKKLTNYFKRIVASISNDPNKRISEIDIIPEEEKKQLLINFNDTHTDYPENKTIHQLFEEQVERNPDHLALMGNEAGWKRRRLEDEKEEVALTYKKLNEKAGQLGCLLQEKGIQPDTIVGIMVERSIEMIIGILGILKSGGAYLPIDPDYPEKRISYMLVDSGTNILFTTPNLSEKFEKLSIVNCQLLMVNEKSPVRRMLDTPPKENSSNLHLPPVTCLAYVIYTSGTTGQPKGTLIEHRNVVRLLFNEKFPFYFSSLDIWTIFHSYCFDFSVWEMYGALLYGGKLIIIPKMVSMDPHRYLEILEKEQVTVLNQTPSAFYNLVNEALNHSNWEKKLRIKYVIFGGETLKPTKLKKWKEKYPGVKLINMFGITETTVHVTYKEINDKEIENNISNIGKPIPTLTTYVLDKNLNPLPIGVAGELCVGGKGVARGYLNRPGLTGEKFVKNLYKPGDRLYKSSDLARFLENGDMEYLGRIDHQVKIRGFRIELGEIEHQLLTHGKIKEAIVLAWEDNNDKYLCAYIVLNSNETIPIDSPELREYLSHRLPGYMVPAYFVQLDKIPLTTNGKIDRKALPASGIKRERDYAAPREKFERKLVDIWSGVLGIEKEKIDINDNFFHLGGHSLKATVLASRIHKEFNINVSITQIFKTPRIRELAECIKGLTKSQYESIEPVEKKDYYQVSSTQKRLYILQQMESGQTTSYNMPYVITLEKEIDKEKLASAFAELIDRHESLRTSFELISGEPVQRIHDSVNFAIHDFGLEKESKKVEEIIANFERPFDLSQAPLLRVGLIKLPFPPTALRSRPSPAAPTTLQKEKSGSKYILLVDMHHIITDDASQNILKREFWALADGRELGPLRLHYKDFSEWQNIQVKEELLQQQETFWLEEFPYDDQLPVLNLPTDYPRPLVQSFEGNSVHFVFTRQETRALRDMAKEIDATLFMCLLSIYTILLAKLSGHEDIIVGIPIAARRHADMEHIIGMFANTLAMRNYPSGEKTFREFFQEVKARTLKAFENQEYPFEELVEKVPIQRDISRNPIFDVMFNLLNQSELNDAIDMPVVDGQDGHQYGNRKRTAKFDLNLTAIDNNGEHLYFDLEYCTRLFKAGTIERMIGYFRGIVALLSVNTELKISELEIITDEEKARILEMSNGVEEASDIDQTIHRWFEDQVVKSSDSIALVGMSQGAQPGAHSLALCSAISFRELNENSNQLASVLMGRGVTVDTIVGLMVERSFEMIAAILAILKAGGAYLPIDMEYPEVRKKYMLQDSQVKLLLTTYETEGISGFIPDYIEIIDPGNVSQYNDPRNKKNPGNPVYISDSNLAYVIYTSGSTGNPKGVILEHRNLVNLFRYQFKYTNIDCSRVLQFATISFDASFHEIFSALLSGGVLYLLDQETRGNIPVLFSYIERNGIKTLFLPMSFLWSVFSEDEFISLFPRCVNHIQTAGEQVKINDKLRRYLEENHVYLHNHYGPSESHVVTTLTIDPTGNIPELPPIGKPILNTAIFILDKNHYLLPIGLSGEMYIGGIQVGRGYLGRPQLTAERFRRTVNSDSSFVISRSLKTNDRISKIPNDQCPMTNDRLYRTGDLARWLPDGNIQFLGRIDHQVKIRGFRIELGEIENQLLTHRKVKKAIVLAREDNNYKYLCAYIMPDDFQPGRARDSLKISGLRKYLLSRLPGYMVPSYFVLMEKIPLSPNGKIDRKALPGPDIKAGDDYEAPRDEIENKLVDIWSAVLGLEKEKISIHDNFFHLGGHSLKAMVMVSRIHKELNVELPLAEIFKTPTIRGLSGYIKGIVKKEYLSIQPVEKKEYYALSSAQMRLYILRQMEADNISYNIPVVLILEGELNRQKIEEVFTQLISRHESLRTSFEMVGNEPLQRVHKEVAFNIEYYELVTDEDNNKLDSFGGKGVQPLVHGSRFVKGTIKNFIGAFDLSQAPLLRVGLIKVEPQKHILMVDMHHIITDGTSQEVLVREFMTLYGNRGEELPALRLQYKDFSGWQNSSMKKQAKIKQEEYWKKQFAGEIPVLHLPTDYPRPAVQSFDGGRISFQIQEQEVTTLNQLALAQGTSLYMVLLSLFTIFLAKITGQQDIVVGTPLAGRRHADLQQIIGMFVNTLGIRNYSDGEKIFSGFLKEVKEIILAAFENQDYPFEDLVETEAVNRDAGRNPLFDVMFVLQNMERTGFEIPGLKLRLYDYENRTSKFDLTLNGVELENSLQFTFEYCTKLFKVETIERFTHYFRKIISSVIKDTEQKISEIDIIPGSEKQLLLYEFNNTYARYPKDKTLHQLFEEQVEQTPDHIAVIGEMQSAERRAQNIEQNVKRYAPCAMHCALTYRKLNEKSNQLGHLLNKKVVQSDTIVGIMVERSLEMIICILGILKAGGAYMPIDPGYPPERIRYMCRDENLKTILIQNKFLERYKGDGEVVDLGDESIYQEPSGNLPVVNSSKDLVYIIYTSGSTGRPKGVLVTHQNILRLVINCNYVELGEETHILQTGVPVFDATTFEIWGTLLNGGQLVLVDNDIILNADRLSKALVKYRISTLWLTATLFNQLVQQNSNIFSGLKYLLIGGDVLSPQTINKVRNENKRLNIINGYGPTENTTFSTTYLVDRDFQENIPIGKPISNSTAYILDRNGWLQPVGVCGELFVGGDGVSRGYLNAPELTIEKFGLDVINRTSLVIGSPKNLSKSTNVPIPMANDRLYRTGDLARWLPDGNIEFLGRIDHQVKIRGFRIELGEIENHLLKHVKIKKAVVVINEVQGDKYICAYIVSDGEPAVSELRDHLFNLVPDYMIPAYFVQLEKIPLTPNHKIDRKALPHPEIKPGTQYIPPRNESEKRLVKIWAEILHLDQNVIGIDHNFFELGGHSLKATILITKIHKELKVKLPLGQIFRTPNIRQLAEYIRGEKTVEYFSIESVEKKEYYVLSSAQKRLYILRQMAAESTNYNLPLVMILKGVLNREKIEEAFTRLIYRHESLRTSFEMVGDEPVQRIHGQVKFKIEYYDIEKVEIKEEEGTGGLAPLPIEPATTLISSFIRPFDLAQAPLLRLGMIKMAEAKHLLMMDMHHIITDGTSLEIFTQELTALYKNKEQLPRLRIQYKDFTQWQNSAAQREAIKKQEEYWLKQFADEVLVLNLPIDFSRGQTQSFEGNWLYKEMGKPETEGLNALARQENATLYMVLLSICYILLSKISSQEDIVIGTPVIGRKHADLENIIGVFFNTLVLRNYPAGNKTFVYFLREVKKSTLEAFDNQDYPFEELVKKSVVKRDPSRNPLFDVMFDFKLLEPETLVVIKGKEQSPAKMHFDFKRKTAKVDLCLLVNEINGRLYFGFEYCTKLYKEETIYTFFKYYVRIVKQVIKNKKIKIRDIELMDEEEKVIVHLGIQKEKEEINVEFEI